MTGQIDRLTIRERPSGSNLMRMRWESLLFAHWRVEPEALRPLLPDEIEVDLHDDSAWIGVIPFTITSTRVRWLPPLPVACAFHELNVRTYVHHRGEPGVWFFSLDASDPLAVRGARRAYGLPYMHARMRLKRRGAEIEYESVRTHRGAPPAELSARWSIGPERPRADSDSLEFFLTERYCLYATRGGSLIQARIHHEPWRLRDATLLEWRSTMTEPLEVLVSGPPDSLLHADRIDADIWRPRRAAGSPSSNDPAITPFAPRPC